MSATYVTKYYDVLDRILFDRYAAHDQAITNMVMAANPGLERQGILLEPGITIALPDKPSGTVGIPMIRRIRLWE